MAKKKNRLHNNHVSFITSLASQPGSTISTPKVMQPRKTIEHDSFRLMFSLNLVRLPEGHRIWQQYNTF